MLQGVDARAIAARAAALQFVHGADLSPDARAVVWCRSHIEDTVEQIDLVHTTLDDQRSTVLVHGGRSTAPEISPDGRSVAFLYEGRDEVPQVAILELGKGENRVVTSLPQGVAGPPRWSPDGAFVAFTATPDVPDERALPYRVTRTVPWQDGVGLVDDAVNDVHVLEVASGGVTRLTDEDRLVLCLDWRPDSSGVVYLTGAGPDEWRGETSVRAASLECGTEELLCGHEILAVAAHRDSVVATTAGPTLTGEATHGLLFVIGDGGSTMPRSGDLDVNGDIIADIPVPFADPDPRLLLHGDDALVRVQVEDRLEIHRVALFGAPSTRVEVATSGCVYPLAVRGDRLLYGSGDRRSAPDLWVRDLRTGESTQVTHTGADNAGRLSPLRIEAVGASADGGPGIAAAFLAPEDSSGPLPTVLLIHGGPESAFGEALFLDAQVLCEAGMGVLLVNPRGSRGYGADFMTAIRGDWGGKDADDLMAVVDAAIDRGLADPERLGVSGLSYGGYMTTWLIGQTNRFRAAVAENPVTNLLSFHGTSDLGLAFAPQLLGGPIESSIEQCMRSSPISNVARVRTPTLLIVSEDDHRCAPEQALQFYSRLRAHGCEAELLMLPGASHAGAVNGTPAVRFAQNEALVDWMARRLLDRPGRGLAGPDVTIGAR